MYIQIYLLIEETNKLAMYTRLFTNIKYKF